MASLSFLFLKYRADVIVEDIDFSLRILKKKIHEDTLDIL